jgi:hypothetical protein
MMMMFLLLLFLFLLLLFVADSNAKYFDLLDRINSRANFFVVGNDNSIHAYAQV